MKTALDDGKLSFAQEMMVFRVAVNVETECNIKFKLVAAISKLNL